MSKILVTGGAGFIGQNLVSKLSESNEVVIFDNGFRGSFTKSDNKNIKFVNGDITKISDWDKIPSGIDSIFHLGAINGMSSEEVKTADNQHSVNGGKPNEKAINLMSPKSAQVVDEGRSDILSAMRQETQTRKMWSSDPAQANPTMSPTELVAHIKAEANPGQGGQTSTDAYRMRRTTRGFDVVVGAKDAFNIAGAEDLAANAFNVAGLSEAMEVEKASHRASQNITSTSTSTGLGADSSFMNELVASQTEELTAMEAESSIVTGVSNEDWTIGSINDLSNEDVGIQGIELEIPELDVSLSDNSATVDADAVDRTPKRNQFRSSNSS